MTDIAPLSTLLESIRTVRQISQQMLDEKIQETSGISADDMHTKKKDIMSLLVRARQTDVIKNSREYTMTDEAMVAQVVRLYSFCWCDD